MVLVDEEWRRQGLASQLMRACLDRAEYLGLAPMLDATEAGRPVYERLGFVTGERIIRMEGRGVRRESGRVADVWMDGVIRPVTDEDMERLSEWDAVRFGASRSHVLRELRRRMPGASFVWERDDEIRGFVLARDGRRSTQVGPVMAEDEEQAIRLVRRALIRLRTASDPAIMIDVSEDQEGLIEYLKTSGFKPVRAFTRMALGIALSVGRSADRFASGGPEMG